ncbi:hypothetical protein FOA52_003134 [Chlamydomonas sp. UWO 241]|nr:hypothetical protein FOA52_003134 [Chlamydomonas sp. UWO 241]
MQAHDTGDDAAASYHAAHAAEAADYPCPLPSAAPSGAPRVASGTASGRGSYLSAAGPSPSSSGRFATPEAPEGSARFIFDGENTVGFRNTIRRYDTRRPILPSPATFEERVECELAKERVVAARRSDTHTM